jgi:AraC-like DNA-binding protein
VDLKWSDEWDGVQAAWLRTYYVCEDVDVSVAVSRVAADSPRWTQVNRTPDTPEAPYRIYFPISPVGIRLRGKPEVVVSRNEVRFHGPDQTYHRRMVAHDGDMSYALVPEHDIVEPILSELGIRGMAPSSIGQVTPALFLRQRQLMTALACTPQDEQGLEHEEACFAVTEAAVHAALTGQAPPARGASRNDQRIAADVRELLAARFAEPLTLVDIGLAVNVSRFHLARAFRRYTGTTIHGYRTSLRLRAAADLLVESNGSDLSTIAHVTGFASHSHLTDAFRRYFGMPPSLAREGLRAA